MTQQRIYKSFQNTKQDGLKRLAVLIDPDKMRLNNVARVLELAARSNVDYFFVGGSLVVNDMMNYCLDAIREIGTIPSILFPGSPQQVNPKADGILLLSLISGRNPDLLIGQHVVAAPMLKRSGLEIVSTGYMLIDGGAPTTASYISGTFPIPSNKAEIAVCTALAGEMLGLKTIYMDAGSGAKNPIPEAMITAVSQNLEIPLIVGGGMRTPERVATNARAGADIIVVGNALEKDPNLVLDMAQAVHEAGRRILV
ncbi:MAG: geranylgeranylglyceryl/heptaprenylglyceryl phosphate synthase [Saprospiraceae bacterium]|nr:geranylgeranylglyceryl/heptaprenylglyceryl phosphate synthase [Saprospiraceae bacterium]